MNKNTEDSMPLMNYPKSENPIDTSAETLSLVYQSHLNGEIVAETVPDDQDAVTWWQEELFTPWTMVALLLLLGANSLLSLAQGLKAQKAEPPQKVTKIQPDQALQPTNNISLDNLSQITLTIAKPVVPPTPTRTLTQALLPKQAQWIPGTPPPQPITNTAVPATVPPTIVQPITNTAVPVPSFRSQSRTNTAVPAKVPPTIVQPITNTAVPAKVPQPTISPNLMQERLQEEIRLREIQPAPLGFNHKTRARLRAASHAEDPTPLVQEMQQEQQQKVPSSIIIGPNGSQVNY